MHLTLNITFIASVLSVPMQLPAMVATRQQTAEPTQKPEVSPSLELVAFESALRPQPNETQTSAEERVRNVLAHACGSIKTSILNAKPEELKQAEEQALTNLSALEQAYKMVCEGNVSLDFKRDFAIACDPEHYCQCIGVVKHEYRYFSVLKAAAWLNLEELVKALVEKCESQEVRLREALTVAQACGHTKLAEYLHQATQLTRLGSLWNACACIVAGDPVGKCNKLPVVEEFLMPLGNGPWTRDELVTYFVPRFLRLKAQILDNVTPEMEQEALRRLRHYKSELERVGGFFEFSFYNDVSHYLKTINRTVIRKINEVRALESAGTHFDGRSLPSETNNTIETVTDTYKHYTLLSAAAAWCGFSDLVKFLVEECNPPYYALKDALRHAQNFGKKEIAEYLARAVVARDAKTILVITDKEVYDEVIFEDGKKVETFDLIDSPRLEPARQFRAQTKAELASVKNDILAHPTKETEQQAISHIRAIKKAADALGMYWDFNTKNYWNNETKGEFLNYSLFQAAASTGLIDLLRVLIIECSPTVISLCNARYAAKDENTIRYMKNVWATYTYLPVGDLAAQITTIMECRNEFHPDMAALIAGIRWSHDHNTWSHVIPCFIDNHYVINHRNRELESLLMAAAERGLMYLAKFLVEELHALTTVKNIQGKTAISIAKEHNHRDLATYLESHQ